LLRDRIDTIVRDSVKDPAKRGYNRLADQV